ncbi:hypothetical protein [Candidatus Uabimicrobium sp. HlEnr_7]|uniref:hypothetical protein n=1 Tax=Candidatus Uabimicrobium helgolandensis TaxID=3095367 RepID=UPI003556D776
MKNTVKKSLWDFIKSFIPNPTELITPWKDFIIFVFFMRYSRSDLYIMYSEVLVNYQFITFNLDVNEKLTINEYEKMMIKQVNKKHRKQDIEAHIEECRLQIQRIIQMLTNAHKIVEVSCLPLEDLWFECRKNGDHLTIRFHLEWEKRINRYVEMHIKSDQTEWCKREKQLFDRKIPLAKTISRYVHIKTTACTIKKLIIVLDTAPYCF